jgi:CYTH domain-containing protein
MKHTTLTWIFYFCIAPLLLSGQTTNEWIERGTRAVRIEEQIKCFNEALAIDASNASAYYNRGRAKAILKRYTEAIVDYSLAIKYQPDHHKAHAYRAHAYEQIRKYPNAQLDYERSLELRPGFFMAEEGLKRLSMQKEINKEIERKFLLDVLPAAIEDIHPVRIEQGYLAIDQDGKEVRLRQIGNRYYLTVKSEGKLSRQELETEITKEQFDILWPGTAGKRLVKDRYLFEEQGNTIEIDVYHGELEGLKVAEVEFSAEKEAHDFQPFSWMGKEVTDDLRYKNKHLFKR